MNSLEKINELYRSWDELDIEYEETKNDNFANQRDYEYMKLEKLVKKYLKNKGEFKKLELSNNWKESDFE